MRVCVQHQQLVLYEQHILRLVLYIQHIFKPLPFSVCARTLTQTHLYSLTHSEYHIQNMLLSKVLHTLDPNHCICYFLRLNSIYFTISNHHKLQRYCIFPVQAAYFRAPVTAMMYRHYFWTMCNHISCFRWAYLATACYGTPTLF